MKRVLVGLLVALTALAVAPTASPGAVPAPHATMPARPCSAGLVALTFDDGPAVGTTPRLVRILRELRADATFFMVGSRVRSAPAEARLVARSGFVVANHTWSHPQLTRLGDAGIAWELRRTRDELRRHGIEPSNLMRPPYGLIDDRVRSVVRGVGLRPVLWTVDSRDWEPNTAGRIAARILGRLRYRGTNIVLQHDGVRRSPTSVDAVPMVVREARRRGYCFTVLGRDGLPKVPVPFVKVTMTPGREEGSRGATVTLQLTRPTTRAVSLRFRTVDGTARAGQDYRAREFRVRWEAGTVRRNVWVGTINDTVPEPDEGYRAVLDRPLGLRIGPKNNYFVRVVSNE